MCRSYVFSIAGSGCCIIMVCFIKLWIGTLWGLLTSFWFCVPKHQEDVLISLGPTVELNLLRFDLGKKEGYATLTSSALFCFCLNICFIESQLEDQPEPHLLKLVSQPLKMLEKAGSLCCGTRNAQHCVSQIHAINHSSAYTRGQNYKPAYLMPFQGVKLVSAVADLNDKVRYLR